VLKNILGFHIKGVYSPNIFDKHPSLDSIHYELKAFAGSYLNNFATSKTVVYYCKMPVCILLSYNQDMEIIIVNNSKLLEMCKYAAREYIASLDKIPTYDTQVSLTDKLEMPNFMNAKMVLGKSTYTKEPKK
jgi:hypothetical protein